MKIRDLDYSNHPVNAEHQALGLPPVERGVTAAAEHPVLRVALWSVLLLMAGVIVYLGTQWLHRPDSLGLARAVLHSEAFWWAVAVGLLAQAVDGALGMAYDRAEFMEQRQQMMQTWADYLDRLREGAKVIPIKAA